MSDPFSCNVLGMAQLIQAHLTGISAKNALDGGSGLRPHSAVVAYSCCWPVGGAPGTLTGSTGDDNASFSAHVAMDLGIVRIWQVDSIWVCASAGNILSDIEGYYIGLTPTMFDIYPYETRLPYVGIYTNFTEMPLPNTLCTEVGGLIGEPDVTLYVVYVDVPVLYVVSVTVPQIPGALPGAGLDVAVALYPLSDAIGGATEVILLEACAQALEYAGLPDSLLRNTCGRTITPGVIYREDI